MYGGIVIVKRWFHLEWDEIDLHIVALVVIVLVLCLVWARYSFLSIGLWALLASAAVVVAPQCFVFERMSDYRNRGDDRWRAYLIVNEVFLVAAMVATVICGCVIRVLFGTMGGAP